MMASKCLGNENIDVDEATLKSMGTLDLINNVQVRTPTRGTLSKWDGDKLALCVSVMF